MAQTNLWKEGLQLFLTQIHIRDVNDQYILNDFLEDKASPEAAIKSCEALKEDAGKKYGGMKISDEVGGAEFSDKAKKFSAKWISSVMGNIDSFVSVGNFTMQGAPESVGMAWFAVKLALTAIQNNYALYNLFGSGLLDLTEMMVIIRHYDLLYDERERPGFKSNDMISKLFAEVKKTYAAMLDFSFSIKKHLAGSGWAHVRHGFKDFFGAEAPKFQAKVDKIADQKKRVLEASDGVFQAKTFDRFDELKGIVEMVKANVQGIQNFQKTSEEFYQTQMAQFDEMMRTLNEVKANTKPKTRWDCATHEFDENRKSLNPLKGTSELLASALNRRHRGTCDWVFGNELYTAWDQVDSRTLLCLNGGDGVGKSTLLATIWERLDRTLDSATAVLLYLSCDVSGAGEMGENSPQSVARIANTLISQLYEVGYELAIDNGNDALLLENCNKVLANPKQKKVSEAMRQQKKEQSLPDLAEAWSRLSAEIGKRVVLVIDAVDRLPEEDQAELCRSFREIISSEGSTDETRPCINILAACRTDMEGSTALDVGHFNRDDIGAKLTAELNIMSDWMEQERNEAKDHILQRAGSDFKYVVQVAIPFIQQPFQRPLSDRLKDLPEGMGETYSQAISAMPSNYLQLLRTALAWMLFAPNAVKVQEIMEDFSGVYLLPPNAEQLQSADEKEATWAGSASELDVKQLRKAAGPFLDIFEEDGQYLVRLRDAPQVRSLCLQESDDMQMDVHDEGSVCARCKSSLTPAKRLDFSEKEGHLDLAITCVRHLNSALFQRRFYTGEYTKEAVEDGDAAAGATEVSASSQPAPEPTGVTEHQPLAFQVNSSSEEDPAEAPFADDRGDEAHAAEENPDNAQETDTMSNDDPAESLDDDDRGEMWQEYMDESIAAQRNATTADDSLLRWAEHLLGRGESLKGSDDEPSPLQAAAYKADSIGMLKLLLTRGSDPNEQQESRQSAFHSWLVTKPDRESVTLFLENGADLRSVFKTSGWSALHYFACVGEDVQVLKLLLGEGSPDDRPNINATDEVGETPLHILLSRRDVPTDLLLAFIDHGADVNIDDKDSERPLHEASFEGNCKIMEIVIPKVTDINDDNKDGRTALHQAAWQGYKECVQLLLKNGARANIADKHNRTPLFYACWGDSVDTAECLLEVLHTQGYSIEDINKATIRNRTPLRQAACRGFVDVVKDLLRMIKTSDAPDAAATINLADTRKGRTALHCAAFWGHTACVSALLDNEADHKLQDKAGKTALELAYGQWTLSDNTAFEDIVYSLIDKDPVAAVADTELRATAAVKGSRRVLGRLHALGADLSRADQYGWTPLMLAKQFRQAEAENFLKQQTSWAGTLPARWVDLPKGATLLENGLGIVYPPGTGRFCIWADKPLPAGLPEYYFEVTSRKMSNEKQTEFPEMAIGFCTLQASAIDFPGWLPSSRAPSARSWGYHGDDGGLGESSGTFEVDPERRYKPGDTVGCVVNIDEGLIWFTRNGIRLEKEFKDLETNFGSRPFVWNKDVGPGDVVSAGKHSGEKVAQSLVTVNGHLEEPQATSGATAGP
ncbi:hypothetical protein B0A55_03055 [Friedmanniomyces simplex]|uniref:B30.2/SPRY domain-containing protein n=1 Tax=Friedmanniomyces simplex TaxID=329884 RepID=A0A4U0XS19_9PEZI|nr:hypothetical protein B0A55_03055 [Friedmanniomyces simplex]